MGRIDDRLAELGIELPRPFAAPAGVEFKFDLVRTSGGLAHVSGHGPVDGDRTLRAGKVGADVSVEEAAEAARLTGLAILASLRAELGELDRVAGWVRAFGMVNCAPGFNKTPAVINGFSALALDHRHQLGPVGESLERPCQRRAGSAPGDDLAVLEADAVAPHEPSIRIVALGARDAADADRGQHSFEPLGVVGGRRIGVEL